MIICYIPNGITYIRSIFIFFVATNADGKAPSYSYDIAETFSKLSFDIDTELSTKWCLTEC